MNDTPKSVCTIQVRHKELTRARHEVAQTQKEYECNDSHETGFT
jgi:hypothetical protein